jgi:hypothetical protein
MPAMNFMPSEQQPMTGVTTTLAGPGELAGESTAAACLPTQPGDSSHLTSLTPKAGQGVQCREITGDDIDAIADLLIRGFGRSRGYWLQGLRRQASRQVPEGYPRYGYMLDNGGAPVGVLLLIYASGNNDGETTVRCNLSSWYVDPKFRNYAMRLTKAAQGSNEVTYLNISARPVIWPIIEAQGFKAYCRGLFFSIPALSRVEAGARVEIVSSETQAIAGLSDAKLELLTRHARYGCISLVCHTARGSSPFIFVPLRIRKGRIATPVVQLVYCRTVEEYVRDAGAIGRFLIKRGNFSVVLDANGPIPGLAGIYSEARGRKYFKGPNPPPLADLTETEFVLYGT